MPTFNRTLSGRNTGASSSRTVTAGTTVAATDLNNEIVYNSASTGVITLPAANTLGATIDDVVLVYVAGVGIPTFIWTGGTVRVPSGMPAGAQYGYMAVKWSAGSEWVQV